MRGGVAATGVTERSLSRSPPARHNTIRPASAARGCSCTSRRSPGAGSAPRPTPFVDWLADAGQSWWQVLPLTPPDPHGSPYASPSAFAGRRRPARASPTRRSARTRSAASASATPTGSTTGSASPGPAPSPTRCASTGSGAPCATHAAGRGVRIIGDLPFYVAPGGADAARPPRALPRRPGRRRPAGRLHRRRPALGQPDVRLGRDARRRLPLVDRAARRAARAARRLAHRPLPGLRVVVGRAPRRRRRRARASGAPAPAAEVDRGRPRASSGRCRWWPRTSGSSPTAVRDLLDRLEPAGHAGAPVRLPGRATTTPTAPSTTPSAPSSTSAPTTTTRPWAGGRRSGDDARRDAAAAALRAGIGDDERPERLLMRLTLVLPRPARGAHGPGPARPRVARAPQHARARRSGNWSWRLRPGELTPELAAWLRTETARAGRLP